jgi:hypothetical protein
LGPIPFALQRPSVKNAASALAPGLHRLREAAIPEGRENQLVAPNRPPRLLLDGAICVRSHSCSLGQVGHVAFPTQPALRVRLTASSSAISRDECPVAIPLPVSAVLQATASSSLTFCIGEGHLRVSPLSPIAGRNLATVAPGREVPSRRQVFMAWDGRARSIGSAPGRA